MLRIEESSPRAHIDPYQRLECYYWGKHCHSDLQDQGPQVSFLSSASWETASPQNNTYIGN